MASLVVLNRVPREKLPQVLAHILDKRAAQVSCFLHDDSEPESIQSDGVFSAEEAQQLSAMLQLSAKEIDDVVVAATCIFQEAAAFRDGILAAALQSEGLNSDAIAAVEKLWRKKGRHVADQLARALPLETTATLRHSQWQLQLELGNRYLSNQSESRAVFQLEIVDETKKNGSEKLDVEMNHAELFDFFQKLNAIQTELDESPAGP